MIVICIAPFMQKTQLKVFPKEIKKTIKENTKLQVGA